MGIKRGGVRGSFIDSVMTTTKHFYGEVVQGLRAWKAPPPKLRKQPEEEQDQDVERPAAFEEALEDAQEEMLEQAGESRPDAEPAPVVEGDH